MPTRRHTLALLPALAWAMSAKALPPRTLQFPRDFGSHPELRTEPRLREEMQARR